jgi:hypothetical protein
MLKDVVAVKPLEPYRLLIQFEDGVEGIIELDKIVRLEGIFAPIQDPSEFGKVRVHPELGVLCWPNGADLDSDVLHALLTHSPIRVKTMV